MLPWTALNSEGRETPAALCADAVVLSVQAAALAVLLVRRDAEPEAGRLALPGAIVRAGETPAAAATRALAAKAGLPPVYLEQLATYADPGRDPRGWLVSIAHLALLPAVADAVADGAAWLPVAAAHGLAFDHDAILADGVERLRWKLWAANVAVGLLPEAFTLGEARAVYEAVLGRALDPGNFARDLRATGLVEEVGDVRRAAAGGRPARLFRFVERHPAWAPRERRTAAR